MENHEKKTLGFLSGDIDESLSGPAHDHISSCPDCKKLFEADMKGEEWFARMREADVPAYLEARVRARLRPVPFYKATWLRLLIPAGALAAALVGIWFWLDVPDLQRHPIDEMVFSRADGVTAAAVTSQDDDDEPVSFMHLSGEENI
jgi:hypothetical protein